MTVAKLDLKRDLRPLYAAGLTPRFVDIPCLPYLMLDGHGDPSMTPEYAVAVSSIYAMAQALRTAARQHSDGVDFAIMPLEALWWSAHKAPASAAGRPSWDWTLMIAVPEFVSDDLVDEARPCASRKNGTGAIDAVRLATLCEGPSVQLMHIGTDSQTVLATAHLHEFISESGHVAAGRHHEIYLSDPNRTAPQRLKTVIRQPVLPGD
jgi:hypothetical protein